jgi:hypothetical protein
MSRHVKPGRNDLCACGSGKKRKHCCDTKPESRRRSYVLMTVVGALVLGGVAAAVLNYNESSSTNPRPGMVWDPAHGHYH